jgi:hypothetical protein
MARIDLTGGEPTIISDDFLADGCGPDDQGSDGGYDSHDGQGPDGEYSLEIIRALLRTSQLNRGRSLP